MKMTAQETLEILKACFALAPVLFAPGYALGWALDWFEFRQRRSITRLTLAIPLSIAICPILSYLLAAFIPAGLWAFYVSATVSCVVLLVRDLQHARISSLSRYSRVVAGILALWVVAAIGSLVDLHIGDKLFLPISTYDHSTRVAIMGAIERQIPPSNPFFAHPAVPLRYHYLWMLLCDLPAKAFHVSARHLMYAGVVWCGLGLMCTMALGLRFLGDDQRSLERKTLMAIALLAVTGLDILPTIYIGRHGRFWLADMEWWNTTQITSWAASLLWVPHHVAALIACFVGFLLLRHATGSAGRRSLIATLVAGVCFASASGASVYVAFTFVVAIALWMLVLIARRDWKELGMFAAAGVVAAIFAAPFLLSLSQPAGSGGGGVKFAEFAVRPFPLGLHVAERLRISMHTRASLTVANLLLLPVNYVLELGFSFAVMIARLRGVLRGKIAATPNEQAAWTLVAASFLIGSFLRSATIVQNDLGFRCFLPAQLVMVLWGASLLDDAWQKRHEPRTGQRGSARHALVVAAFATMLVVGLAGSAYEVFMIRMTPVLYDRWQLAGLQGLDGSPQAAQRTNAVREIYAALNAKLPKSAVVQNNPATVNFVPHLLYSGHDAVAGTVDCSAAFGGNPKVCEERVIRIVTIFLPGEHELEPVCRAYGIDVMVAQDTDPAWHEPSSWIWQATPLVANNFVRAFRCPADSSKHQ